jgi:L-lactate utilization protein LutB
MDVKARFFEERAKKAVEALIKNGFEALYVPTLQDALQKVLELVPEKATVGFGGSMTTREMNLPQIMKERGHKVFDHYVGDEKERAAARKGELTADVFIASSNALTLDGKLVNIDGTGNRVAAMIFGPGQVILVVGANKITENLEQALRRAKNIASPLNVIRLNCKTPCVSTGHCHDCSSEANICRITTIIEKRPNFTPFTVIVVGEEIGY